MYLNRDSKPRAFHFPEWSLPSTRCNAGMGAERGHARGIHLRLVPDGTSCGSIAGHILPESVVDAYLEQNPDVGIVVLERDIPESDGPVVYY